MYHQLLKIHKMSISIKMLKKVLSIQSKSDRNGEKDLIMRNYIKSVLSSESISYFEDDYGNIYATKGKAETYPCVVSHTDTVHDIQDSFNIYRTGNFFYAFNNINVKQVGIGGDDKVGIYLTLQFLKDQDIAKAVFFRNEEIGRLGSRQSIKTNKDFYKDCRYVFQPDRVHNSDFITKSGGVKMCDSKFNNKCKEIYKEYGYKEVVGIATDVDVLVEGGIGVSCINFSCGYYRSHSDTEVVNISEVNDVYNLITDLVEHLGDTKYNYTYIKPKPKIHNATYPQQTISFEYKIFKPLDAKRSSVMDPYKTNPNSLFYKSKTYHSIYKLKQDDPIIIPEKCPVCKDKQTVYFLPSENSYYCVGKKCNSFINDKDKLLNLRKKTYVKDTDSTLYYHNTYLNAWYKQSTCTWSMITGTYQSSL